MDRTRYTAVASASVSVSASASASSTQESVRAPTKTRSSCDRCHTQKLRCVTQPNKTSCERCVRLAARCHFSPRAARGARTMRNAQSRGEQRTLQNDLPDHPTSLEPSQDDVNGGGWLLSQNTATAINRPINLDSAPPLDTLVASNAFGIPHNAVDAIDVAGDFQPMLGLLELEDITSSACLGMANLHQARPLPSASVSASRTLAGLNVRISDCAANFPGLQDTTDASAVAPPNALHFVFDDLFSLTAEFTTVLQSLWGPSSPFVDEAVLFMVAACHWRLAAVYASVFEKMQACIRHSSIPRAGTGGWTVVLPRLQVGSQSLPLAQVDDKTPMSSKATAAMYMMLLTALSSQLWGHMADVLQAGRGTTALPLVSSLSATTWDAVTCSTHGLIQTITAIQSLLF